TASSGPVRFEASVADLTLPREAPSCVEDLADAFDWKVEHLPVTPELFAYLPPALSKVRDDYSPEGPASVAYRFRRDGTTCRKDYTFRPEGMTAEFVGFRYKVEGVTGSVERALTSDGDSRLTFDLAGVAGSRPATLTGTVRR